MKTASFARSRWCVRLLAVAIYFSCTVHGGAVEINNFVSYNTLADGEIETRIYYDGVAAKETTVGVRNESGLKFRQLTDGKHFIQLIYDANETISDCEYISQRDQVREFLSTFKRELGRLIATTSNFTVESLDSDNNNDNDTKKSLPANIRKWFDYRALKTLCKRRHRDILRRMHHFESPHANRIGIDANDTLPERSSNDGDDDGDDEVGKERRRRSLIKEYLIVPGTMWCGYSDLANSYRDLGDISRTDKCCRRHDSCKRNIPGFTKRYRYFNNSPFTISHCRCDTSRRKRDILDLLRVPETKWCGLGYTATKYTSVGSFSRTDKCCRVHDLACPFWIGGFQRKYGVFNWRVNTLMHCSCDERFRTCLKLVDTSDSNLVGKLFFNTVQTKCFVLRPKKVCVKRKWWSPKCTKWKHRRQAVLRDNLRY